MTNKIEVPRELLERLANIGRITSGSSHRDSLNAVSELRALLAAPEAPRQEPVAWMALNRDGFPEKCLPSDPEGFPVYRAPLSPDHLGGGAGMVLPEDREVAAEQLFYAINPDSKWWKMQEELKDRYRNAVKSALTVQELEEFQSWKKEAGK